MGYFLEKTWLWWLLAIVIAVLVTWLIFRWRSRGAATGDDVSAAELSRLRSAAETHDRELQELHAERDAAQQQLAALQAEHDSCRQPAGARAAVLPTHAERVTGELPKVSE